MQRKRLLPGAIFVWLLTIALVVPTNVSSAETVYHWKFYVDAVKLMDEGKYAQAIPKLQEALKYSEEAAYLRKLAEAYEATNQFQKAAETYYREAEVARRIGEKSGDLNTYFAVLAKADSLNTSIEFYAEQAGKAVSPVKLAKFEPERGMYIGAYIEKDNNVRQSGVEKYKMFNGLAGKQQAIYLTYQQYGSSFPTYWAQQVKAAGGAIQLAFEPNGGLDKVKDDEYLREYARAAQAVGVPIFLRFASEMNGNWVPWNGNPALYIEKFRLVANVMKEEAPNVAMLWSPGANPKNKIHDYYPGDEWVDWVGVSLYSVKFFNGDPTKPAAHVNPLDSLDYIYRAYADRKPIMISEFGATHFSKADNKDATLFAITKMSMLYHGAKLKYPRVKAIHWFSMNTLTDSPNAERSLNNFSLTENGELLQAYGKLTQDPYYLSSVPLNEGGPSVATASRSNIVRLDEETVRGDATGYIWVKTYDPYISKVVIRVNGVQAAVRTQYPFSYPIDASKLGVGAQQLEVIVYDSQGREAARKSLKFKTGHPVGELKENEIRMYLGDRFAYTAEGMLQLQAAPYSEKGNTLVPLRFISEQLGAKVKWNAANKSVTITGKKTIVLTQDSTQAVVDGKTQQIDAAPRMKNGALFVPLRFINGLLGGSTSYKASEQSISIFPLYAKSSS